LLSASERSAGGYRLYDQAAVERLGFIARAKQLGLPLEEIKDLLTAWELGSCGPLQQRLRPLLDQKIDQVTERIAELTAFAAQLQQTRRQLDRHTPAGPCDQDCGCLAAETASESDRRPLAGIALIPLRTTGPCPDPDISSARTTS
jgi:DNA-binding transcriptional MerR regulator